MTNATLTVPSLRLVSGVNAGNAYALFCGVMALAPCGGTLPEGVELENYTPSLIKNTARATSRFIIDPPPSLTFVISYLPRVPQLYNIKDNCATFTLYLIFFLKLPNPTCSPKTRNGFQLQSLQLTIWLSPDMHCVRKKNPPHGFIPQDQLPPHCVLLRPVWKSLNRHRTQVCPIRKKCVSGGSGMLI